MSENQLVDLFVEDGQGGYIGIDPRTIALAVKDEKNSSDVQEFINIGLRFVGNWDCTNQIDFSRITKPRKKGDIFKVVGTETTINNITYKSGDYIIFNIDVLESEIIDTSKVDILLGYGNEGESLPPQEGKEGKYLKTNGISASWEDLTSPAVFRQWD